MSTLVFVHWSWRFPVCPCGGKLDMSDEMLSSIRQTHCRCLMKFQGTRGAKHGVHPWEKHHYIAKESMRKIHKKGIFSSVLDHFQNDEVFLASQLQHNWTKEWCESLDYARTIDITHNASPEQLERYAVMNHSRYDPKQMEKSPIKRRPDYHQTTRAIVSMNKETSQTQESKRPHNYREDLDPEKLDWLVWLPYNWKWYFAVNQISALDSTHWHHQTFF